uniref:Globin domain-containing protein n=1 Tax=Oryzias sinensis TaxID=183150 RepID=A0A8C7YK45_9TELE
MQLRERLNRHHDLNSCLGSYGQIRRKTGVCTFTFHIPSPWIVFLHPNSCHYAIKLLGWFVFGEEINVTRCSLSGSERLTDGCCSCCCRLGNRLFETHPECKDVFFLFRDVEDLERLRTNRELRAHGLRVMSFIEKSVARLDQPERLEALAVELGKSHYHYNAPPKYYNVRSSSSGCLDEFLSSAHQINISFAPIIILIDAYNCVLLPSMWEQSSSVLCSPS